MWFLGALWLMGIAKRGRIDVMPERSVITWTAMIDGYRRLAAAALHASQGGHKLTGPT